jgi:hypothetical protein
MKTRIWPVWAALLLVGVSLAPAQDEMSRRRDGPVGRASDGILVSVDEKLPAGQRQQGLDRADGRALDKGAGRISDRLDGRRTGGWIEGRPGERISVEDGSARGINETLKGARPVDGAGVPQGLDKPTEQIRFSVDGEPVDRQQPAMGVYGLRNAPPGNPLNTKIDPGRQSAWEAAQVQANQRVKNFDSALKSGNPDSIRKAALDLGSDPIAVQKINQGHPELVNAHNQVTDGIKAQTRQNIKENMAKQWNQSHPDKPPISAKDVEIFEPTNWREPGAAPKSGQDWDVTVRVNGKDVPPAQSKAVVEKSYFDAAGGKKTFGAKATPESVAHQQAVETTHGKSPDAYKEPDKILGTKSSRPEPGKNLQDPEQLTHAVENKSVQSRNKAADARAAGNEVEAVRQDYEQMRQASKQYEKITKPRVEAHGGKISDKVDEGMRILGEVGPNGRSPESARAKLAEMGETPESIIKKASGQAEAVEKLTPTRKAPGETVEGKPRGPATDAPDGKPRVVADGPDGAPPKPGKFGKALEVVGKGMQIVDIFSNAEDAKQAIKDGDMKKLGEVGINTVDGFTGGAIGTGRMVNDRLNTARGEKNEAQAEARRMAQEAQEQQMRVDLRRGGYSKEQVEQIMDARAKGDDSGLKAGYEKIGKEIPKAAQTDPTWKDTLGNYGSEVWDNTKEVGVGIKDKTVKAGKFLNETRKDLTEIGTGLTDSGTRKELVSQQSENIRDWWKDGSGRKENQQAGETIAGGKDGMKDYLIKHGATPEGAEKAAEAMYDKGDPSKFHRLMDMLKDKEARRQQAEGKDPLKQGEATAETPDPEALKKGEKSNVLQDLGQAKAEKSSEHARTSIGINQDHQQVSETSTSGDRVTQVAGLTKDQAGADALNTRDQSTAQTAAEQQKGSMKNILGDALTQSLAAGGAAMGNAVGASAAGSVGASLFGPSGRSGGGRGKQSGKQKDDQSADVATTKVTGDGGKKAGVKQVASKRGDTKPSSEKSDDKTTDGSTATTGTPTTTPTASTGKTPSQNCPTCGKPMTPIVIPKDPTRLDDYRWACMECGTKDSRPLPPTTTKPATTPGVSKPPTPPPEVHKCPRCGGVVTDSAWYMSNYGPAIKCPHCKGAIKVGWYPARK